MWVPIGQIGHLMSYVCHELTQRRFGSIYQVPIWSEVCALQSTNRPSRSQWAMSPINELGQEQVLLRSVKTSAEGLWYPWSLNSVEINQVIMVFKPDHWNGLIAILKDCSQCVDYDGTISKICPITNGILHESILGSLLFIIYMKDIHEVSSSFKTISYADDTNLISPLCLFSKSASAKNMSLTALRNGSI